MLNLHVLLNKMNMQKDKNPTQDIFYSKESIFFSLPEEDKQFLILHTLCKEYGKNELVFSEDTKPKALICLSSGKVKIFKEGVGGREQIVRLAKPGGFIGYRALFAGQNYHASAMTLENSTVCYIDKKALFEVMNKDTQLTFGILRSLATELGFSNMRTVSLTQKHIRGRLAESLLFLIDTYGFDDDGSTIKAYLSREDVANLSNMTTSNAIRTLSTFASERVIGLEGRKIKIMCIDKLKRISELG
jgi:CRP/FNR family transcriptional regulator, polysaccharide utilization system transcription regulator